MNRGCSASNACGSCTSEAVATTSCHHTSRPSFQATSSPVRLTTSTFSTLGQCSTASSTAGFNGIEPPRRNCPSVVMTTFASASSIRLRSASALKPPKTTEWGAPMRAHASIATTACGIIGM